MGEKVDVLVIGAGPAGLTAAVELVRFGHRVRIIDKGARPTELSKAVAVNPRSLELLEPAGVTPRLIAEGVKVRRGVVHNGLKPMLRIDLGRIRHRFNFMLALSQSKTERVLETRLGELGVTVERHSELQSFTETGEGVEALVAMPNRQEIMRAAYLLGADGAHSTVRTSLGLGFKGAQYPYEWTLADVQLSWNHDDAEINAFSYTGGRFLFTVEIGDGRHRLISNTRDAMGLLPPDAKVEEVFWTSDFHVSHRIVEAYGRGRAYLIGDAAHIHSPAGGRGMNLGIEDACEFAWRLTHGGLTTFRRDRRKLGVAVVRQTDAMFRVAVAKSPVGRIMRNLLAPVVSFLGGPPLRFLENVMGLDPRRRIPDGGGQ